MVEVKVSHSATGSIRFHQHYPACGDLMTDLLLQDLKNLTSEGLMQTLSNEKKEMFGEQRVPAKERGVDRLFSSSFAGSFTKVGKARGEENVTK